MAGLAVLVAAGGLQLVLVVLLLQQVKVMLAVRVRRRLLNHIEAVAAGVLAL
jgi:hypothetical protein